MHETLEARNDSSPRSVLHALAASILVLLAGTTFAANGFDCDDANGISNDARRLNELHISVVDLNTDRDAVLDEPALLVDESEALTPVLKLGPRVATIVRDVFGEEQRRSGDDAHNAREATIAPLAGSSSQAAPPAIMDSDETQDDTGGYSPLRIHREMYRTDI